MGRRTQKLFWKATMKIIISYANRLPSGTYQMGKLIINWQPCCLNESISLYKKYLAAFSQASSDQYYFITFLSHPFSKKLRGAFPASCLHPYPHKAEWNLNTCTPCEDLTSAYFTGCHVKHFSLLRFLIKVSQPLKTVFIVHF